MREFKKGDIVQHFKMELLSEEEFDKNPNMYLYYIMGEARHTETDEKLMIYQALYGEKEIFVRPYKMFMEEVDRIKYPNVKQKYRFELANVPENYHKVMTEFIGNWCAFCSPSGQIWHGKIIEVYKGYIRVIKKNSERISVNYSEFIGFCNKPTKLEKNPMIRSFSIYKYLDIININKELLQLKIDYMNFIDESIIKDKLTQIISNPIFIKYSEEIVIPDELQIFLIK